MTAILLLLAGLGAIAAWWLAREGIATKPWLHAGLVEEAGRGPPVPAAKIGLGVFLAVVGALFTLFLSAYSMRTAAPDWSAPPLPKLLWLNTAVLMLASAALETARTAARGSDRDLLRECLAVATGAGAVFLIGQILAWQQLAASGYAPAAAPGNGFFYLLTGLHGLHVLGGLVALLRTMGRTGPTLPARNGQAALSVELCAFYWHFLLIVWLVLLTVLAGWAGEVIALCRAIIA